MLIRFTLILSLVFVSLGVNAQVTRLQNKPVQEDKKELSIRAREFLEATQPDKGKDSWTRVVYRELDFAKGGNASLFYPEDPIPGGTNLFRIIMSELLDGSIDAYEYLDGREIFTEEYESNIKDILDRYYIPYQEKRSPMGKMTYVVDPSDIPNNEVLSYYVIEKWVFDKTSSTFYSMIEAICPILYRAGDFGGENVKYPMFWIEYSSLRPALTQHLIMSDGLNNAMRYNFDDFFVLRQYDGDIYKVRNLRNLSLMQQYPDPDSLKVAREKIEKELKSFDQSLWVAKWVNPQEEVQESKKSSNKDFSEGDLVEEKEEKTSTRREVSNPRELTTQKGESSSKNESRSSNRTPVRSVRRTR